MYTKIINPLTNRKVNITSKLGKKILKKYLFTLNYTGGAHNQAIPPVPPPPLQPVPPPPQPVPPPPQPIAPLQPVPPPPPQPILQRQNAWLPQPIPPRPILRRQNAWWPQYYSSAAAVSGEDSEYNACAASGEHLEYCAHAARAE